MAGQECKSVTAGKEERSWVSLGPDYYALGLEGIRVKRGKGGKQNGAANVSAPRTEQCRTLWLFALGRRGAAAMGGPGRNGHWQARLR